MNKPTLRCSELDRILNCPGSRKLCAIVKPRDGGEGWEGTKIHNEIAWRLVNEQGADQPDGGIPLPNLPEGYVLPKYSEWLVDYCCRVAKETIPDDFAMEVESAFCYAFEQFTLSGHIDVYGINFDATECVGMDWKTGYKAVDQADQNEQFLGYIVLLIRAFPTLRKITFLGVQPRNSEENGYERITSVTIEGSAIDGLLERFEARINAALSNENELNTGRAQCAWCSAATQCPAIQQEIENMKMTLTPELLAKIKTEPDDGLLGDLVLSAKIIDRPIEDATELLKARIAAKGEVVAASGTRITAKTTRSAYKCLDPVAFYKTVHELISDKDKLAKALSYPGGRIKDAIAEDRDIPKTGKSGTNAEAIFNASLAPFCEQGTRTILQFD